jgi:phage-related protein
VIFNILAVNDTAPAFDAVKGEMAEVGAASAEMADEVESSSAKASAGTDGLAGSFKSMAEAAGLFAAGDFLKSSIDAAESAQVTIAQTGTVLKSTGDLAGITAAQVQSLSDKYGELAGVQGIAVQGAMNTLLRSSGVQTALASGVESGDQLTDTLVNMAAAMAHGGDVSASLGTAANALSKALADPFTASKALTAAGDPLTAAQVAQIAVFKKAGDTAGAYKIVLDSLASSTAGDAASAGTPMQRLSAQFDDFKVALGTKLMPTVDQLSEALMSMAPTLETVVDDFGDVVNFVTAHGDIFGPLALGIAAGALAFKAINAGIAIFKAVSSTVSFAVKLLTGDFEALDAATDANPFVIIAAVIIGIGVAFYEAYEHSQTFRDIVNGVIHAVIGFFQNLWDKVHSVFDSVKNAASDVIDFIKNNWHLLLAILLGPFGLLIDAVQVHWAFLKGLFSTLIGWIKSAWSAVAPILEEPFKLAWDVLQPVFKQYTNWIKDFMQGMKDLGGVISKVWGGIQSAISDVWSAIVSAFNASGLGKIFSAVSSFASGASGVLGSVGSFFGFASGGTVGQGGYAIVGENGPELVALPGGSQVIPNGAATVASRNTSVHAANGTMVSSPYGGGGSGALTIQVTGDSSDLLVQMLRKQIRLQGGSVQKVLGAAS